MSEIEARLRVVEQEIALCKQLFQNNLLTLTQLVERHDRLLYGTVDTPGLDKRADRLEQTERYRTWHLRAVWVAVLGTIASVLRWIIK